MFAVNDWGFVEVCDGPGDFQQTVIRADTERGAFKTGSQDAPGILCQRTVFFCLCAGELPVKRERFIAVSLVLDLKGLFYPGADRR